jgi:hypothetical protein
MAAFDITRVDVWAGEIKDRPGALADMLKAVLDAGADLDFIVARPSPVKPHTGILYLAPLVGERQQQAAEGAGMTKASLVDGLRLAGPDRQGIAAHVTRVLADAGVNLSGLTGGRMGNQFVMHLRFESAKQVDTAEQVLRQSLTLGDLCGAGSFRLTAAGPRCMR